MVVMRSLVLVSLCAACSFHSPVVGTDAPTSEPKADARLVDASAVPVDADTCDKAACQAAGGDCDGGVCVIDATGTTSVTCPAGMPCAVRGTTIRACQNGVDC